MQFFAFLYDSYKEAVSGWILQITLVLATIFILVVASASMEPVSVKEDLDPKIEALAFANLFDRESGQASYRVENFRQTNDAEAWKGNYAFDIVVRCPTEQQLKQARANFRQPTSKGRLKLLFGELFPYLDNVEISEGTLEEGGDAPKQPAPKEPKEKEAGKDKAEPPAEGSGPKAIRFNVTTRGTKAEDRLSWLHKGSLFFGAMPLGIMSLREWVYNLQTTLLNDIGAWALLLIGIVVTANFIPNLMRKGAIDLIISKPVGRFSLLFYKYLGGLTFVLLLVTSAVLGSWMILGIRYNFWNVNFLSLIPILTFYFAALYSISVFIGVLTRSTVVAILVTIIAWGLFTLVGWGNKTYNEKLDKIKEVREVMDKVGSDGIVDEGTIIPRERILEELRPGAFTTTCHYLVFITPRTYDIDKIASRVTARGILSDFELKKRKFDKDPPESPYQVLGSSLLFVGLMIGLSYLRFATRDGG